MKKPTPTQVENPFRFDELFFSTTDKLGVIQFGNDVFVRVSGYSKEVLKGAPHSIVRHPDVPRAVFKLLWDTLKSGNPIAAYVKNMSASGNYYWVYAFVFPIQESYLSVRIKPSSAIFKAVQSLYAQTLEVETKGGMEASVPFLLEQVKKSGFRDYTDFMIQAGFTEINAVQNHIKNVPTENQTGILQEISDISSTTLALLKNCFQRIQEFQKVSQAMATTTHGLNEGFQSLKFIALNMTISAAKFGEQASSLGVVAKEFSVLSERIRTHLSGLEEFADVLNSVVQTCTWRIIALEIQMLMVDSFIKESIQKIKTHENAFADMIENKEMFTKLFSEYSSRLQSEVISLGKYLKDITTRMSEIKRFTTGLQMIRQMGAVESARLNEAKLTFAHYLEEMERFLTLLQSSNIEIQKGISELDEGSHIVSEVAVTLSGKVSTLFDKAASYSVKASSNMKVSSQESHA